MVICGAGSHGSVITARPSVPVEFAVDAIKQGTYLPLNTVEKFKMVFMRKTLLLCLICLPVAGTASAADAKKSTKIQKCQDASGAWHYGRRAAEECTASKIIEMDQRGLTRKVIAAPPTELDQKKREQIEAERQKEEQKLADQKRRDQVLLGMYGHEDDIILVRDRKLSQLENSIKATEDTLTALRSALARIQAQGAEEEKSSKGISDQTAMGIKRTEAQIANHEAAIATKREEQRSLREEFAADLVRYRELKNPPSTSSSPETNKK
jgi:hypothetical protein